MTVPISRAAVAGFCLLAAVAYGPALDNPLLFDDEILIAGNDRLTLANAPALVSRDFFDLFPGQLTSWRPVSVLSYMANRSVFGEWYPGWRGVYLLMHVANALLLAFLFTRWGAASLPALAAGAVFLLHPVHSEVVNEISYNEEPMVSLFVLLAMLALGRSASRGAWRGAAAAAAFVLALGCKESALMLLPVAAALHLSAPATDAPGERRRRLLILALLAGIALAYLVLRFRVLTNPVDLRTMLLTAGGVSRGLPTLLMLLAVYLGRFLWPVGLSAVHDLQPPGWNDPRVWAGLLIALGLAGAAAWGIARRRPTAAIPSVVFGASMLPLGYAILFAGEVYAYDRYLYLPSVGLAWYLALLLDRARRPAVLALPLAACLAFVPLVWQRDRTWSDPVLFWEDNVRKAPDNAHAWAALGWLRLGRGEPEEAIDAYREALRLKPDFADARFNLGLLYHRQGLMREAEENYRLVLEKDPANVGALLNLAAARFSAGRADEAAGLYERVLAVDPSNAPAREMLSRIRIFGTPAN